ncbi:MAG TPA: endolytic transglycosylase MltG [Thermomicrobiales bacterium]|nr:endolytic transglycosylase MltG [Thermomicrobiales bacterium]
MLRVLVQSLKIVSVIALTLLVAAASVRFFAYAVNRAVPDDAGQPVTVTIGKDDTTDQVAARLQQEGLIRNKLLFDGQMRLSGNAFEPGSYTLRKGMTVEQIIDRITGGQQVAQAPADSAAPAGPKTFDITIPEGWRTEQVAEEYERLGGKGGADAFMQAVGAVDRSQYDFLSGLSGDNALEGYLFPDTYTFRADDPGADVAMMLDNFGKKFTPDMRQRTSQMQLTIPQVLTFASLVEREAQVPAERPIIAAVYLNRYEQGWNLEADPTVQYVFGKKGDWWPSPLTEDQLQTVNPFNTYKTGGLPPGPICNPGFASIQAVLFPADTPYMFFVAKGDSGEHAFAVTKEEQDANVAKYQTGAATP